VLLRALRLMMVVAAPVARSSHPGDQIFASPMN
jgi:hypothetical protein